MNDDVDIYNHIRLTDNDFSSTNDATTPWLITHNNHMANIESQLINQQNPIETIPLVNVPYFLSVQTKYQ